MKNLWKARRAGGAEPGEGSRGLGARSGASGRRLVVPKGQSLGLLLTAWAAGRDNDYQEIGSWDRHTLNLQRNDPRAQ